jgi:hypothetical protein
MKNKKGIYAKIIASAFMILFLLLFLCYFLLGFYYRTGFSLNTWINGVYCTGKTVEEVNQELLSQTEAPIVVLKSEKYNLTDTFDFTDYGYSADYLAALNSYMSGQKALLWIDNITLHKNHSIIPDIIYDENKFRESFNDAVSVRAYADKEESYELVYSDTEDGWSLYDGLSCRMDTDKAFECIMDMIAQGSGEIVISLDDLDCFYDVELNEEQRQIKDIWERLEWFLKFDIVYDMGDDNISIPKSVLSSFIKREYNAEMGKSGMYYPVLDGQGNFVADEESIAAFIDGIAKEYDTYGKDREFLSTRGDVVTVPSGGTYGTLIDRKAEVKYLCDNLLSEDYRTGISKSRIPEYEKQGVVRGKNDIGDTYIEVDMTEQKMYYYSDGRIVIETDIVTGNTGRKMGTPQGINYVYNKQKDRVLRGQDYATPVKFWVPVKGSIGIHDASWRSEFGGEIYKTNGSHGCINTPTEVMEELYDMVEIGTPVIMFY